MKKILLITTGGTIASIQTDKGLVPGLDGKQLIEFIPRLNDMCNIDVRAVFNIDSTNVYYKHWLELVKVIKEEYDNYDGFVICHGTDTLSYTASALSYLIQNSKKPIVITGSQKPINMDITDAKAKDLIVKSDKKRASYYNYYTNKTWGDAKSYDLCINSAKLGIDGAVDAIINYVNLRHQIEKPRI